jgi:hypothetical protein
MEARDQSRAQVVEAFLEAAQLAQLSRREKRREGTGSHQSV